MSHQRKSKAGSMTILVVYLGLLLMAGCCSLSPPQERANILLILADDLGCAELLAEWKAYAEKIKLPD